MTTKSERKALADRVRKAAAYIDRVGLHQGESYDIQALRAKTGSLPVGRGIEAAVQNDVKCCTLGALDGYGLLDNGDLDDDLGRFLAKRHPRAEVSSFDDDGTKIADVPEWNDKPSRRKKDVVELLTAFADKIEKEGLA